MYLSTDERITLIKSTLFNLPTYFMSLFFLPAGVANHIGKLQQDSLWGRLGDEFKYLISWFKFLSQRVRGLKFAFDQTCLFGEMALALLHEIEASCEEL
jgi:hypothetical protein